MATTVEPIGSTGGPHMHRSVSGSAPGSSAGKNRLDYIKSMGWINRGFVFSVLGGLQLSVVIVGLINVSLLGASMSHENNGASHYGVAGLSFHAFLFDVAFWCFMSSFILLITSATSVNTATSLPKTTFGQRPMSKGPLLRRDLHETYYDFRLVADLAMGRNLGIFMNSAKPISRFIGYHGTAVLFYLIASITVFVEAAKYAAINNPNQVNVKTLIYAGGGFGIIETILYVAITVFGVAKFRQNRE